MLTLTKQVAFSASHFYWLDHWPEAKNRAVFGACANREGHGHNYRVDVTLAGEVDPKTGMLINFFDLMPILDRVILIPLDHTNLNKQVPWFQNHLPTLENIALYLWQQLSPAIEQTGLTLHNIKVIENDDLEMDYEGRQMLYLTRKYSFSAAHKLWNDALSEIENKQHFGPCTRVHGHNYTLEITIAGEPDAETGMIVPLQDLDRLIRDEILDKVDHRWLDNEVAFLAGTLSTVENVTQAFYRILAPHIQPPQRLYRVRVYESEQNWAEIVTSLEEAVMKEEAV